MARRKVLKPQTPRMVLKILPLSMLSDPDKFGMRIAVPMATTGGAVLLNKTHTVLRRTEAEKKRHKLARKLGKPPAGFQYRAD